MKVITCSSNIAVFMPHKQHLSITYAERDGKTERKGSGGGEQKRMPAWRKIANIVENDVSTVGSRV
jgi:hypothetical protein